MFTEYPFRNAADDKGLFQAVLSKKVGDCGSAVFKLLLGKIEAAYLGGRIIRM